MLDPASILLLIITTSTLILGIVSHIKSSRCGTCIIESVAVSNNLPNETTLLKIHRDN